MEEKNDFYTLKGYQLKGDHFLTESMEDYLEMIYRHFKTKERIRINELASSLHVKPSSVSKMVDKLQNHLLVTCEKYGDIYLTELGKQQGKYLLWRHDTLVDFFKNLNKNNYSLEQVEKLEHFIDKVTLQNIEKWNKEKNF